MSPLVKFYRGEIPFPEGKKISEIWNSSREWLETRHDFIQWLFPLKEPSNFNPIAPVLDADTIAAFRTDQKIQKSLHKSFELMLNFYGFAYANRRRGETNEIEPIMGMFYCRRIAEWATPRNHNILRITRIIGSLRILSLHHEIQVEPWLTQLVLLKDNYPNAITSTTIKFWEAAPLPPKL